MEREESEEKLSRKVLIAEDSPVQAAKLKFILEEQGYEVRVADNGARALEIMQEGWRPFLIISDIIMPEMDGYELCRRVRQDGELKEIPVVLLTSLSEMGDVIKGLECGANNFITKPYNEEQLISRLEQLRENVILRENLKDEQGIRVFFSGEYHLITSDPPRILDLLLSIYESAYQQNRELLKTQNELRTLNEELDGKVVERTAALTKEIAERKRAEEMLQKKNEELRDMTQQLWQAAKLATMGELAASIAHELNNPLATINLRIEFLLERTPLDSPHRRELAIIEQEVGRMSNLIANLLQFSRRGRQQISTLDVCEEIEKTIELIYYHLRKYNIRMVTEFAPLLPKIRADRQQLRQLFLNIFVNAGDAMPQGGTIITRVAMVPGEENIRIEIDDTGMGIPGEILARVTEPFYTTKGEGKGTGLGLAICQRIVREHRGALEIMSEGVPGKGTKVRITLPLAGNNSVLYLTE